MKKLLTLLPFIIFFSGIAIAQTEELKEETTENKKENVKTGFGFGALPVVAYDTDIGFKYGVLTNLYHYGDGSRYPKYDHSLYLEWSRTTKGNGINQIIYDSDRLIPNVRVTTEVSYMTEKALNFYGFNGNKSFYNPDFEDDTSPDYISRVFYRLERKSLRLKADFQGSIVKKKLRWLAGIEFHNTKIASVDIDKLNEGKDDKDKLPEVKGLYDYYKDWGVVKASEADGGKNALLKVGLVYDTRDIEANPSKGMWDEVVLLASPKFFGYDEFTLSALLMHRQYFTIFPNTLTFAYRLAYRTKLTGNVPFYLLPYMTDSKAIVDAFGGAKTIRGILRDRLIADGVALGNFEFRWKVVKTKLFKQNFYIALSSFCDVGRVINDYDFKLEKGPVVLKINDKSYEALEWLNYDSETLHIGYGGGLHFALNENFILAIDYGMAAKKQDGTSGLYINLNWLF